MPVLNQDSVDKRTGLVLIRQSGSYQLSSSIRTKGTGIVVLARQVRLDLNGHTVEYGTADPIRVPNGDFSGGRDEWNLQAAPSAMPDGIVPGMPGKGTLRLENFQTEQIIESAEISIPEAGRKYVATVTAKGAFCTVRLAVVEAQSGTELGTSQKMDPERGFGLTAAFDAVATGPVRLRLYIVPVAGKMPQLNLGFAQLYHAGDFGIVASPAGYYFPKQLAFLANAVRAVGQVQIFNGNLVQGSSQSLGGSPLNMTAVKGALLKELNAVVTGMDTHGIDGMYAEDVTVTSCTLRSESPWISNRMQVFSAIRLWKVNRAIEVTDNTIEKFPQAGISVLDNKGGRVTIASNTIQNEALVSNPYAIYLSGISNFVVAENTIRTTNGRGIDLDSVGDIETANGEIVDNSVIVAQRPNLEYPASAMAATALRIRNWGTPQRNLHVSGNTFVATTGPGEVHEAIALRVTQANKAGRAADVGNLIENNVFRAIVTTSDPTYRAAAVSISGVDDGTDLRFDKNRLESNDICLRFGDRDSYGKVNAGVTFTATTFGRLQTADARPFISIEAGAAETGLHNATLTDCTFENGATDEVRFSGSALKELELGKTGAARRKLKQDAKKKK